MKSTEGWTASLGFLLKQAPIKTLFPGKTYSSLEGHKQCRLHNDSMHWGQGKENYIFLDSDLCAMEDVSLSELVMRKTTKGCWSLLEDGKGKGGTVSSY